MNGLKIPSKDYLVSFLVLFLSYGLCFLTWFPGVGMNDGLNILCWGKGECRQHPVFFVVTVLTCKKIGYLFGNSLNYGIAVYVFLQILMACALTAVIITWFFRKKPPLWSRILFGGYYVFHPLLAMYSISVLKDTLFSLALTIFCIACYELTQPSRGEDLLRNRNVSAGFCLLAMFVILWRNNGKYIIFPTLILMFVRKRYLRKLTAAAFAAAVAAVVLNSSVTAHFGRKQMFQEVVGIPLQQICRVIAEDGVITLEQKEFMDHLIPLEEIRQRYNPRSVDPIKWSGLFNEKYLSEHKGEFLRIWFQMLGPNFSTYVKAYLEATYYFWRPVTGRSAECYFTITTVSNNDWLPAFIMENGIADAPVIRGKPGEVLKAYYHLATRSPSEAAYFWFLMILTAFTCIMSRKTEPFWAFLPLFFLWATIMVSTPVAGSMRYVIAFVYALPVMITVYADSLKK